MRVFPTENRSLLHIRFPGRGLTRLSLGLAAPLAVAYSQSGLVAHRSLMAILATHLMIFGLLPVAAVLIGDSAAKARVEVQRRRYLGLLETKTTKGRVVRSAHR